VNETPITYIVGFLLFTNISC